MKDLPLYMTIYVCVHSVLAAVCVCIQCLQLCVCAFSACSCVCVHSVLEAVCVCIQCLKLCVCAFSACSCVCVCIQCLQLRKVVSPAVLTDSIMHDQLQFLVYRLYCNYTFLTILFCCTCSGGSNCRLEIKRKKFSGLMERVGSGVPSKVPGF